MAAIINKMGIIIKNFTISERLNIFFLAAFFCEDVSLTVEDTGFFEAMFSLEVSNCDEDSATCEELCVVELVCTLDEDEPSLSDEDENSTCTEPDDTLLLDDSYNEDSSLDTSSCTELLCSVSGNDELFSATTQKPARQIQSVSRAADIFLIFKTVVPRINMLYPSKEAWLRACRNERKHRSGPADQAVHSVR